MVQTSIRERRSALSFDAAAVAVYFLVCICSAPATACRKASKTTVATEVKREVVVKVPSTIALGSVVAEAASRAAEAEVVRYVPSEGALSGDEVEACVDRAEFVGAQAAADVANRSTTTKVTHSEFDELNTQLTEAVTEACKASYAGLPPVYVRIFLLRVEGERQELSVVRQVRPQSAASCETSANIQRSIDAQRARAKNCAKLLAGQLKLFGRCDPPAIRTVLAECILESANRGVKVDLNQAVIAGPLKAAESSFPADVSLIGFTFDDEVDFTRARFQGTFDMSGSTFSSRATFKGVQFGGPLVRRCPDSC